MGLEDDLGKRILDFSFDRWHSRTGIAGILTVIFVAGIILFAGLDFSKISNAEWAILATVLAGVWFYWWLTRIEKTPKGRVGFGVAIELEDSKEAQQLRSDFTVTLRNLIAGSRLKHRFAFIEFTQSIAQRITNEEQALWLFRKSRLHFLIYGRARLRVTPRGPAHVINLSWMVRHQPIEPERSARFVQESRSIFPGQLILGEAGNVFAAEFGAALVDAVARYVIGTAAALSNDFEYAEQLLLDSERRLSDYAKQAQGAHFGVLLDRVRQRIIELYRAWIAGLSREYASKRNDSLLAAAEQIAGRLRSYEPTDYGAHLTVGMAAFLLRRDLDLARREIAACRELDDATWMYSEAFLIAYEGDLEGAYRMYRRAFESPLGDPTVPMQCEEFMQIVLDQEPDRRCLYYCLGLLNYRAKGDLEAARADFGRFLESADPSQYKRQIEVATKWVQEIEAILGRGEWRSSNVISAAGESTEAT